MVRGPTLVHVISGRGWITGIHTHMLAPDDPWPHEKDDEA